MHGSRLLAAEGLYEADPTLFALAAIVLAGWYVTLAVVAVIRWPKQPRSGPPTTELRPESPAVANLLVNGWLLNEDALPATLLDLAARGHVVIEDRGDFQFVCRLPRNSPRDALHPFERRVLAHLRRLAGGGAVPAGALTTGPQEESRGWWRGFRSEVSDVAKATGVAREFWPARLTVIMLLLGVPVFLLIQAAQGFREAEEVATTPFQTAVIYAMWVGLLPLGLLAASARLRDTEVGRVAAAHWMGVKKSLETLPSLGDLPPSGVTTWERHFAYGAAMGSAGRAIRTLPFGAESDRRAWTDHGGDWKQVRVRYPRFRPHWGMHPGLALFVGLIRSTVALVALRIALGLGLFNPATYSKSEPLWLKAIVLVVGALLLSFTAWSVLGVARATMDLTRTENVVKGEVLRARAKSRVFDMFYNSEDVHYVAVYTGKEDEVMAWAVKPALYPSFIQGDIVTVAVTPDLGYVKEVKRVVR